MGTIAPYQRYLTAFEYSPEWLEAGFSISPFSLPLEKGVLLVDRMLRSEGEDPDRITPFSSLSIVGSSGMGALEYKPVFELNY